MRLSSPQFLMLLSVKERGVPRGSRATLSALRRFGLVEFVEVRLSPDLVGGKFQLTQAGQDWMKENCNIPRVAND